MRGHFCFVHELFPKSCCRAAVRRWRMLPCLLFCLIAISSLIKFTPIQINPVSVAFWVIFYYHQKNSVTVALLLLMRPKEADACLIGCLKSFKHERRGAAKQCVKWITIALKKKNLWTLNLFLCFASLPLQYVPPDLCICTFVLEQSLSVRALQEMLAKSGQNSEGVSDAKHNANNNQNKDTNTHAHTQGKTKG